MNQQWPIPEKKTTKGGRGWGAVWEYIFSEKENLLEFLAFPVCLWKFQNQRKQAYRSAGNSTKLWDTPSCGNPRSKTKTHWKLHMSLLNTPANSTSFLTDPRPWNLQFLPASAYCLNNKGEVLIKWKLRSVKSSQANFFSNIRIYIRSIKKIQFSITNISEIKATATTAIIKNEVKYFLMPEGIISV